MQEPRDHHFIPVFYLKRWTSNHGKLVEYSRPYRSLVIKHVGPKATGFQRELYSFPELTDENRHILESRFFHNTDQLASDALDRLYSGNTKWTPELRSAWSRFVLNFRVRHPDPMREMRDYIRATWNRSDDYYEAEYAKIRRPDSPATLTEFMASLGPEEGQKIQLRLLMSTLDNERIGQRINEMQWDVLDLSKANYPLLTSDWPSDLPLARGVLSLPIGPHLLFVGAVDTKTLRDMRSVSRNRIVAATNKFVTAKARRYVYARDESQTSFIDKYMSKDMFKPPFWPSLGATHAANVKATQPSR